MIPPTLTKGEDRCFIVRIAVGLSSPQFGIAHRGWSQGEIPSFGVQRRAKMQPQGKLAAGRFLRLTDRGVSRHLPPQICLDNPLQQARTPHLVYFSIWCGCETYVDHQSANLKTQFRDEHGSTGRREPPRGRPAQTLRGRARRVPASGFGRQPMAPLRTRQIPCPL